MNKFLTLFLGGSAAVLTFLAFALVDVSLAIAEESSSAKTIDGHLQRVFPGKEIKINDYDGLLKEVVVGSDHLFTSHDGRYVFAGPIYDTDRKVDIVSERESWSRNELLSTQAMALFVRYPSTVEQKHQITVVTDIDCPYCRKLHNSLGELNEQGVSVNYLMLPRAGINSESYFKTLDALCSDDAAANVTRAMAKQTLMASSGECDPAQLTQHMQLAQKMKIRSTPTFVLPNGALQVGWLSTGHLLSLLGEINL